MTNGIITITMNSIYLSSITPPTVFMEWIRYIEPLKSLPHILNNHVWFPHYKCFSLFHSAHNADSSSETNITQKILPLHLIPKHSFIIWNIPSPKYTSATRAMSSANGNPSHAQHTVNVPLTPHTHTHTRKSISKVPMNCKVRTSFQGLNSNALPIMLNFFSFFYYCYAMLAWL